MRKLKLMHGTPIQLHLPRAVWALGIFLIGLVVFSGDLFAQESEEAAPTSAAFMNYAELPESVPPLPGPEESGSPLIVNHSNVASFHEVLLAPMVAWLKAEQMSFAVIRRLNFAWSLSASWNQGTEDSLGAFDLAQDNSIFLDTKPLSATGYPFGNAGRINEVEDPTEKAFHILWNSAFAMLPTQDALYGIELQWIGKRKLVRKASGAFFRVLNRNLSTAETVEEAAPSGVASSSSALAAKQVTLAPGQDVAQDVLEAQIESPVYKTIFWQEVLKLFSPPGVYGYAAVSERYFGPQEDNFWIYSPVLGQSRRILASNRGDGIVGGLLNLDDFFLWGMKTQAVTAKVVEEKTLLLPFPSLGMYGLVPEQVIVQLPQARKLANQEQLDPESGDAKSPVRQKETKPVEVTETVLTSRGYYRRADQASAMVLWNHESRRYESNAAWVPTSVFFVPRKVWIVEVAPKDPYYLTGRQVLVIDQESFLPFYKVIYNRGGEYERMLMAGWALASSNNGTTKLPVPGFVLAVSNGSEPSMALGVKYARTFLGKKTPASAELYDLLNIEAHQKAAEAQEQLPEHAEEE